MSKETDVKYVRFLRPAIFYARGDVIETDQAYIDKVIIPYVREHFNNDQDGYWELTTKPEDSPVIPAIPEEEPVDELPVEQPPVDPYHELVEQAVELGINPEDYKTEKDLQKAIDKASKK